MGDKKQNIAIVGAGLVGSLFAIYMAKRGHAVSVFERRPDMRKVLTDGGRSINLSLSNRGLRALREVGLEETVRQAAIPMTGRMVHDVSGQVSLQPYGRQGEFINSISRTDLNKLLLDSAEKAGVAFQFEEKCIDVDIETTSINLSGSHPSFDQIIGADGAWSAVRSSLLRTGRFTYGQNFIEHGYKEFHIPPGSGLEKNALHIWPRASFMMIALPNPDDSFTATLFYPYEGIASFQLLENDDSIRRFFHSAFPDFIKVAPDYLNDFHHNPTGSLATIHCWPWVKNNTVLIGDAAHGILPFYGQGMNAGFEDCRILNGLLDTYDGDWHAALKEYQNRRKPDTDTIAALALDNFTEMRDLVADEDFRLRKKIEARLNALYPLKWIPLYSMVTFHDEIRYSDAHAMGLRQKAIMDEVLRMPDIHSNWEHLDFSEVVSQL